MHLTFRWYGPADPVTLQRIRQIPAVEGIVTSLHEITPGELWPNDAIEGRMDEVTAAGLRLSVLESLPVHDDIKLGAPSTARLLDVYCENLRRIGHAGIGTVCYNFMPLMDWFRTDLRHGLPDGSSTLAFDERALRDIPDPFAAGLPAWSPVEEPDRYLDAFRKLEPEELWENLARFIETVAPVAEECGVHLGIHPDDPPWSIYGMPRIITDEAALERVLTLSDSPANGLTFCSGSLGALEHNDLVAIVRRFAERIHFVHLRNVGRTGEHAFIETAHAFGCGDVDLPGIVRALADAGYDGPARPDHGRMIWEETGKPGYGLHDRALGVMYLAGLRDATG